MLSVLMEQMHIHHNIIHMGDALWLAESSCFTRALLLYHWALKAAAANPVYFCSSGLRFGQQSYMEGTVTVFGKSEV